MEEVELIGKLAAWIVPAVVAVAAFVKFCWNSRDAHARVMLELMREFQRDHADSFYALVERKDSSFYRGNLTFDTTENERKADAMLLFLENVMHFRSKKVISNDEFIHFEYYLKRIVGDPDFGRYLHEFGLACCDGKVINPFVHILEYCRAQDVFAHSRKESAGGSVKSCGCFDVGGDKSDARAASEEEFVRYLEIRYHSMTRTARSVKSRVDNYLPKKGWSYEQPPTKGELLTAIKTVCADVNNPDTAASIRAALRQYYRASFGEEPNA